MQLPIGSTISYQYSLYQDSAGTEYPWITQRITPDGTWTYAQRVVNTCGSGVVNCQQTNTITKPSGDATVYTFTLNGGAWRNEIQSYTGSASSGTLLSTVTDCWNFVTITNGTCTYSTTSGSGATGVQKIAETTTLPVPGSSNVYKTTEYSYDGYGNTTAVEEWNFYTGTLPTNADRTTTINYLSTTSYVNALILNRPTSVTVTDKNGNTVAQTNYSYDGSSLTSATGKKNHDDTNYPTSNTVRGNVTQIQRLVSGTSTYLTTTMTYDMLGNLLNTTDPNSNTTSYDYTDNLYDDPGDGSTPSTHSLSTASNAYLKTITYPTVNSVTLTQTLGSYWGTGQQTLATDANGNTSYSHFHESLNRPTSTALPNNEWTRITYNSTDTQIDSYTGISNNSSASTSCTVCRHDQTVLDGQGRVTSQRLVNDPDGETYVDTTYDSDGRMATVSNPYRGSSNGVETPSYDGLNRTTQVTHADNNVAKTSYGAGVGTGGGKTSQGCSGYGLGYPTLVVDEVGNKRQMWMDGLGRVIETDEPDSTGSLTVYTCYAYDLNNNLIGVLQPGSQSTCTVNSVNYNRCFSYDFLSRITSKTMPESQGGTTSYYYTTSGGGLCSGDPSAICRRTDARSITTTYAYDALNRLTSTSYNDSNPTTPTVNYYYDQTSYNSLTITNGKGHRTGMSDGSGATAWSYDSVGNILTENRTINSVTKTISYAYNLDGTVATITYPGGRVVTYSEGNAQRPTAAQDTGNSINYATSPSSGAMYSPTGAPGNILHGYVSGGFAGITETYSYNNRLQVTAIEATSSGGTPLNLSYSYVSGNNGNIATQTNNVTSGRTQAYTYDPLNRLLTAQASATSGNDCWGQGFGNNATPPTLGDDALANLLVTSATKCSSPALSTSVNSYNQISSPTGYSYDGDGNMTADNSFTYTYDAENRIRSADVGGTYYCYIYDGNGLRVEKATASSSACSSATAYELYWRNTAGNTIAETDGSGSTTNSSYTEYIFFEGRRIAQSNPSSGVVNYYFVDHLGSTRVVTSATGSACWEADYYPYGQEKTPAGFSDTCSTHYKFTGYERDPETDPGNGTGNDYAFARYYSPRLGRFMSADPWNGDLSDPQTLNKYADVRNNPVNITDPSGMFLGPLPPPPVFEFPNPWGNGDGGVWTQIEEGDCFTGPCGYLTVLIAPPAPPPTPAQRKKKSNLPPPCPPTPPAPPGASVDANINSLLAIGSRSDGTVNGSIGSVTSMYATFWKNVQDSGPWDYKVTAGPQFDAFGNFNFGATGAAINIPSQLLLRGAGLKKYIKSGGEANPTTPLGNYPYGNQLDKEDAIQDGINYWKAVDSGCYSLVKG